MPLAAVRSSVLAGAIVPGRLAVRDEDGQKPAAMTSDLRELGEPVAADRVGHDPPAGLVGDEERDRERAGRDEAEAGDDGAEDLPHANRQEEGDEQDDDRAPSVTSMGESGYQSMVGSGTPSEERFRRPAR